MTSWTPPVPDPAEAHIPSADLWRKVAGKAARDIVLERMRQITVEGWLPSHDDQHAVGELAAAAACYITNVCEGGDPEGEGRPPFGWPWSHDWWKPTNPRRDLVKAGALILAEIERLDRMAEKAGGASAAALQRTATIDPDAAEGRT